MTAYYNEIDPFAVAWLQELMAKGAVAPGDIDTRSIEDVSPDDLRPYTQCHFFAGIGVWSYALRLAGWRDDTPVWTGSCPCQPFSAAGKREGVADERHLWPSMLHLIKERRPQLWFGEQVASPDGLHWLDIVRNDLEGEGYAVGAVDTSSALTGAPHIRQRLRLVAERVEDPDLPPCPRQRTVGGESVRREEAMRPAGECLASELGGNGQYPRMFQEYAPSGLGYAELHGHNSPQRGEVEGGEEPRSRMLKFKGSDTPADPPPPHVNWSDADWLFCRDGKWRPVEPRTFPLAHGSPASLGRLRGYGNAVDAAATKTFIEAYASVLVDRVQWD